MENFITPCNIRYFIKENDDKIYNFWLFFDNDEDNGVRLVGTYSDAIERAKILLTTRFNIDLVTIYNDKLDNYFCEVSRYEE